MKYFVYVIYSLNAQRKYIGHTENIEMRLIQHNNGLLGIYTKNKGPWELIYSEELESRSEAMIREKYLKTGVGRDFIKSKTGL
jgi:putative endonuclease